MRFLDSLGIPIIAVLRDSQNFVRSAEEGVGLCEMQPSRVKPDVAEMTKIVQWLDAWPKRRQRAAAIHAMKRKPVNNRSILRRPRFGSA